MSGTVAIDRAVADARSLPDLVNKLKAVDPATAQAIEGKALIASKTPWGTILAAGISWAAAKYGLGWDANLCALIAGIGVLAGSYSMRWISTGPIRGIFSRHSAT